MRTSLLWTGLWEKTESFTYAAIHFSSKQTFGEWKSSKGNSLHCFVLIINTLKIRTHKAGRIRLICSHFAVNFHQSLVDDLLDFIVRESILQTVPQKHGKRQALAKSVWTAAWTRCLKFPTRIAISYFSSESRNHLVHHLWNNHIQ